MNNILVVEDESDIGFLIMRKFRKQIKAEALSFWFTSNGMEALDLLNRTPEMHLPTIALVDINMPQMDGLTFLAHLRELFPFIKAIMVTAYGDMTNIRQAMNLGAFDFLQKPINFDDLDITIKKALEEATARQSGEQEKRYLRAICERANFGAVITDLAGKVLYSNPYFAQIHGYEPEEVSGQSFAMFHTKSQMQQVSRMFKGLHNTSHFRTLEVWHVRRDGTEFPMLMDGVLVRDEQGEPQYIVIIAIYLIER